MAQQFDACAGLPEFFITDVRIEMLPGDCLRVVFIHPTEGDMAAIVIPWTCWMETRVKFAQFIAQQGQGRNVPITAH